MLGYQLAVFLGAAFSLSWIPSLFTQFIDPWSSFVKNPTATTDHVSLAESRTGLRTQLGNLDSFDSPSNRLFDILSLHSVIVQKKGTFHSDTPLITLPAFTEKDISPALGTSVSQYYPEGIFASNLIVDFDQGLASNSRRSCSQKQITIANTQFSVISMIYGGPSHIISVVSHKEGWLIFDDLVGIPKYAADPSRSLPPSFFIFSVHLEAQTLPYLQTPPSLAIKFKVVLFLCTMIPHSGSFLEISDQDQNHAKQIFGFSTSASRKALMPMSKSSNVHFTSARKKLLQLKSQSKDNDVLSILLFLTEKLIGALDFFCVWKGWEYRLAVVLIDMKPPNFPDWPADEIPLSAIQHVNGPIIFNIIKNGTPSSLYQKITVGSRLFHKIGHITDDFSYSGHLLFDKHLLPTPVEYRGTSNISFINLNPPSANTNVFIEVFFQC